jgi:hypothetical protein
MGRIRGCEEAKRRGPCFKEEVFIMKGREKVVAIPMWIQ